MPVNQPSCLSRALRTLEARVPLLSGQVQACLLTQMSFLCATFHSSYVIIYTFFVFQAEPVVREGLKHISEGCVFIYCQVGERPYWKDPNNDFRKNLKVTAVPTLLKYGTPQKLVESECLQANLVEMLFSED
uniref:Thioredoxin domain-containing protein 17 n=2 Tax=Canis lupus familiaris TaxID=9615 RepID=A0A8I3MEZ9_CANLF|eukprot:XP_005620372.1 thioredoxin domain-containing protein 17 [Canis lupus familiaris]